MVIANPMYDVVFKRMMENDRVAKFFIGTLLDQQIEQVEVKPQEFTYADELAGIAVFRLDFIATIQTETGEFKKVLIEIQKAKNYIDLIRFRNYLGEQYKKQDKINGENVSLPITTIYILGFMLPEIASACLKVERNYKDLINKKIIDKKSDFVEKLTHDCFIVQVDRITDRYQTTLDQLLSIFEQNNFVDDSKIIKEFTHQINSEDLKVTTDILHHSGINPQQRKLIETEQEAWRTVNAIFEDKEKKYQKELDQQRKTIEDKDKAIEDKDKEIESKEKEYKKEIENKEQEIEDKDKTIEDKDRINADLLKQLEELKRQLNN
jgi:hypothetical protein